MQLTMEGDNWNMIEMKESSYLINEVDSGDADDILSYSSSDADDQTHPKRRLDGRSLRKETETFRMFTCKRLKFGKALKVNIKRSYLLKTLTYLVILAGIVNLLLLGGFIRQVNHFAKTHEVNCSNSNMFSSMRCHIDEYLGHLAYQYRKSHKNAIYDTGIVNTQRMKTDLAQIQRSLQVHIRIANQKLSTVYQDIKPKMGVLVGKIRQMKPLGIHQWHQRIQPFLLSKTYQLKIFSKHSFESLCRNSRTQLANANNFYHSAEKTLTIFAASVVSHYRLKIRPNLPTNFQFTTILTTFSTSLSREYHKILNLFKLKSTST